MSPGFWRKIENCAPVCLGGGVSLLTGVSNEHGDVRRDSQILVRTPGEAIMNKPMTYAEKNKTSQTKSLKVKTNIKAGELHLMRRF